MYAYRWLGGAVLHMRYSVHVHPFELGLSQGGRIIRARGHPGAGEPVWVGIDSSKEIFRVLQRGGGRRRGV